MNFATAMQHKGTQTENGMPTNTSSGSAIVDLFYNMGAMRAQSDEALRVLFSAAYTEDRLLALKAAFYNRDVRGGQGERRSFRVFFRWLCDVEPAAAIANVPNVPEYGRWDDLLEARGTPVQQAAFDYLAQALAAGDKLCAKWMPREGSKGHGDAQVLRKHLGLSWVDYRKLLAGNTDVVETKMCRKEWAAINYNHVPSQAVHKYRKAWKRNDEARYTEWTTKLATGAPDVKVNAGAIYPHQLVETFLQQGWHARTVEGAERQQVEAQWAALPDYVQPKGRKVLPMCDVSGSMAGEPMLVSVALGLYLAERNTGPFKDLVLTFSGQPAFFQCNQATLQDRVHALADAPWGMNTNLEAAFELILRQAKQVNLPAEEMPELVLILSDMQFDACVARADNSALEMIDRQYAEAGYKRPQVVFWNLRASTGVPVGHRAGGTALVSGFSPSIMTSLLGGRDLTPLGLVLETLNRDRYARVVAP